MLVFFKKIVNDESFAAVFKIGLLFCTTETFNKFFYLYFKRNEYQKI